jgi:hypothetical protein
MKIFHIVTATIIVSRPLIEDGRLKVRGYTSQVASRRLQAENKVKERT